MFKTVVVGPRPWGSHYVLQRPHYDPTAFMATLVRLGRSAKLASLLRVKTRAWCDGTITKDT